MGQKSATRLDVHLDRQPLWSALAKVGREAGVGFTGLADNQVALAPLTDAAGATDKIAGPAAEDGPFALCIQRVEVTSARSRILQEFAVAAVTRWPMPSSARQSG